MSKTRPEILDRQLWNLENHADRIGWRPDPYGCKEILEYLAAHPEKDNSLLRWYIGTQLLNGGSNAGDKSTPF